MLLVPTGFILHAGVTEYPDARAKLQIERIKSGAATRAELVKAVGEHNSHVRVVAAKALAKIGREAKPTVPALIDALGHLDPGSWTAAQTLEAIGPDAAAATPALVEAGKTGTIISGNTERNPLRSSASKALARIGPAALPAIKELLEDENVFVRCCAAEAIGMMGPEARDAVQALVYALKDEDKLVSRRASRSLQTIDPNWSQTEVPNSPLPEN